MQVQTLPWESVMPTYRASLAWCWVPRSVRWYPCLSRWLQNKWFPRYPKSISRWEFHWEWTPRAGSEESGLSLCVWHFRKRHRSDDKCTRKKSRQSRVCEKWELQTHSACDCRYRGPGHAVAILGMWKHTAALNTLTHRLLRPGAESQASSTTCKCDTITGGKHTKSPYHPPICSLASSLQKSSLWPYPVGKEGAPSCWPGASTWQTAKCWVISCISSKLKKVLKQDLSMRQEHPWITRSPTLPSFPLLSNAEPLLSPSLFSNSPLKWGVCTQPHSSCWRKTPQEASLCPESNWFSTLHCGTNTLWMFAGFPGGEQNNLLPTMLSFMHLTLARRHSQLLITT